MNKFIDLNKFTKISKIGQGTFGEVFKVKENDTGDIFAGKILTEIISQEDKTLDLKCEVSIL